MLKRIASTGINLVVLGISVGIFLVAFIVLNALGAAQKPPTVSVLQVGIDSDSRNKQATSVSTFKNDVNTQNYSFDFNASRMHSYPTHRDPLVTHKLCRELRWTQFEYDNQLSEC